MGGAQPSRLPPIPPPPPPHCCAQAAVFLPACVCPPARVQVRLTEEDTEYKVLCTKHVFDAHMVFQFDCTNTISEQILDNVNVVMDLAEAVSAGGARGGGGVGGSGLGGLQAGFIVLGFERV